MAVNENASVTASLKGGDQVAREAGKIKKVFKEIGQEAKNAAEKGVKALGSSIGSTISDSLRAANILQTINLASGIESAKRFTEETSKLARQSGESFTSVGGKLTALEARTLTSADAIGVFARALGRSTYDAKSATGAVAGLGDFAQATGRDLEEGLDIGATLRSSLGVVGDVSSELERLRSIGENVGTKGGYTALVDTLAAIKPQLDQVAVGSDKARAELEALVAVSTKGLRPQQAQQVAGGLLATIKARALDIERLTGTRVLDDSGNVANPLQAIKDLQRIGAKKFGKDKEAQRRAYISEFGPDLGTAILRTDTSEVERTAQLGGQRKIAAEAEASRNSPEGKRKQLQIERDKALRSAGESFLGFESTLIDTLGVPGAIATNLFGLPLLAKGAGALATGAGKAALGGIQAGGLGALAAPAAVTASFALPALGVLAEIGEDSDTTGKKYRASHADIVGQGLANRALREGDLTGAYIETGGNAELQAALLEGIEKLVASNRAIPGELARQIEGLKLQVRPAPADPNPNADRGN